MAVSIFGVTAASVASIHFPQWVGGFNANTKPTSTSVGTQIDRFGARINAALYAENITASSIVADTAAYLMCAEQLTRMTAVWVLEVSTQQNPELAKKLQAELDAWFTGLSGGGATFLGDDSLASSGPDPDGPTSHVTQYDLETDVAADMSTTVPRLRRDDEL